MAENTDATMDMDAHQQTYNSFIHLTVLTVVFCIAVIVMLAVGNAGAWGLAGFGVFLSVIAVVVGFLMKGSAIPNLVVIAGILGLKLLFG